jgi:hypothetical protein
LSKEILAGRNPDETQIGSKTPEGEKIKEDWKGYLFGGGYILGFSASVYLLGFIMAIPLFILYYLKSHKTGWQATLLYAVLITATIYSVFELVWTSSCTGGYCLPQYSSRRSHLHPTLPALGGTKPSK